MKAAPDAGFQLDVRLAADTFFVAEWNLCRVLLMDDARFPWLVLVPRREGLAELNYRGNAFYPESPGCGHPAGS